MIDRDRAAERLDGRVALVTGASRGIGAAIARALAELGSAVVLAARDHSALDALASEIDALGGEAAIAPVDFLEPTSVEQLVERVRSGFGRLDILVNNAGVLPPARRVERVTPVEWNDALTLNLTTPWLLACRAKELMSQGGVIVNVASTAAFYPSVGLAPYNVSKAGLVMLTRVCALEWARDNIRVVALAPGKVGTDLVQPILEFVEQHGAPLNLLGRVADVDEIADLVTYLVSDRASYVTGTVVTIDGGEVVATGAPVA